MNDWQSWEPGPSAPAAGPTSPTQQRITNTRDARDLAAIIADLQDRVRALEVTPRLGHSSIENGTLDVIENGVTMLAIGKQPDGTFVPAPLDGPIPPTPIAPVVTGVQGGLNIRWDGTFEGNQVAPMDFARVEVHTDTQAGFDPMLAENLRASITNPRGGEVFISLDPETLHYVVLVARAQSGKASDPSVQIAGTVPATPGFSDGEPPTASPAPTVIGGIGVLHVRWDGIENNSPVTYEVHVSTQDGFTPTPMTKVAETSATALTVKTLPDGSPLTYGLPVAPTVYRVRIVAKDEDPGTAPPSAQGSASLHLVDNTDISAAYAYIGDLAADQITSGILDASIALAGEFKTADTGQRAVMDSQGIHLFSATGNTPIVDLPVDPNKAAQFRGEAAMTDVSVSRKLTVASGSGGAGQMLLADRVSAPAIGPGVVMDHEVGATPFTNLPVPTAPGSFGSTYNVVTACMVGTNAYLVCQGTIATGAQGGQKTYRVVRLPVNGGDPTGSWNLGSNDDVNGICWDGTQFWLLVRNKATDQFYARAYNTDFTLILDEVLLTNYRTSDNATRTNLVPNPSFEVNTTDWSAGYLTTIARDTTQAMFGSASLKLTATAANGCRLYQTNGVRSDVTPGAAYTISLYVKSPTVARSVALHISWYDTAGYETNPPEYEGAPQMSTVGQWTRLSWTTTAPPTAGQMWPEFNVLGAASGEVHYFDGFLIEKSGTLGDYFDGSTVPSRPGAVAWTGTAHNSNSTYTPYVYYGQGIGHDTVNDRLVCGFLRNQASPVNPVSVVTFPRTGAHTLTAYSGSPTSADAPTSRGFVVGTVDFTDNIPRIFLNDNGQIRCYYFASDGSGLIEDLRKGFEASTDGGVGGKDLLCWDPNEGRFRQIRQQVSVAAGATTFGPVSWKKFATSSMMNKYDSDIALLWWASYTWRDSDPGGTGLHETDQGNRTSFRMKDRYRLRLSAQAIPDYGGVDDPNAVSFYLGYSPTWMFADPGRGSMYRQGGILADGVTTLDLSAVAFSGTNPPDPTTNPIAFPAAAPAFLQSQGRRLDGQPKIKMDGSGAGNLDGLIPPGTVQMWAGLSTKIPTGWLLCDGRQVSRTVYNDLAAALFDGTNYIYGNGDLSTTFNLPDFQHRVPFGAYNDLATNEGQAVASRSASLSHNHQHTGVDHLHGTAGISANTAGMSYPTGTLVANGTAKEVTTKGAMDGHSHGMSHGHGNTGAADRNLNSGFTDFNHPRLHLHFIIKA